MVSTLLTDLRRRHAALPPPLIVFNKSHSGSRLLARALAGQGIFMGAAVNESLDALPLVGLVEHLVERHYPDFAGLWSAAEPATADLARLVDATFAAHLATYDRVAAGPWGWKLCESGYILPFLDFLFPDARFVHLVRDGRDVAFCDHVAPQKPFWRKIYFNTDRIERWRGRPLDNRAYDRCRHVYNALHWRNSVEVGRAYGAMLRQRCRVVRYEALCADFPGTMAEVLAFAGVAANPAAIDAMAATVHCRSIGKHRHQSWLRRRQVQALIAPTLASFGYVDGAAPG